MVYARSAGGWGRRQITWAMGMNDISVGAVGAAAIAGLVSLFGLIIGKEQKVSEFRQAWIDNLRTALVAYLVNINAIADAIKFKADPTALQPLYKALNEASHGITLRVNAKEGPSKALLKTMREFELLASSNSSFTPEKLKVGEEAFLRAAKKLLKFEWKRVRRGEPTFIWAKWITVGATGCMLIAFICLWVTRPPPSPASCLSATPHVTQH